MNKRGVTLSILIIYIIVIIILAGSITVGFLKSSQIGKTSSKMFEARMKEYIDEYDTNKKYNQINGVDISELTIDELIPSITVSDKQFLKLNEDGDLEAYNIDENDERYSILVNLRLINETD